MPKRLFFLFFWLIWFLPPLVKYFEFDSYTITTVAMVMLFSLAAVMFQRKIVLRKFFLNYFVTAVFLLIINIMVTMFVFDKGYDIVRGITSFFLIIIFIFGAYIFSNTLVRYDKKSFDRFFTRVMYFFLVIIVVSFFTKSIFTQYLKPIFPYSEPSHLALFFGPVICYNILSAKNARHRLLLVLLGLAVALVIKNMTLLVTLIIISVFIYHVYFIPLAVVGSAIFYFFADLEYFMSRLDFGESDTDNLSVLVYRKGFEIIIEALDKSKGLGIGFQQLGYVPVETPTQKMLYDLFKEVLNEKDGGFLVSKLVAEFGVVGIILVVLYLVLLVKSWFRFRKLNINEIKLTQAIYFSSFITIFSEFFFRGLSYFTPSIFLFLVSVFLYRTERIRDKREIKV